MPGDLQILLLNVSFLTLLRQRLLGQQTTKIRIATVSSLFYLSTLTIYVKIRQNRSALAANQ